MTDNLSVVTGNEELVRYCYSSSSVGGASRAYTEFLPPPKDYKKISVDRITLAGKERAILSGIAGLRTRQKNHPAKRFHGWYILTARDARGRSRQRLVEEDATSENLYHANIVLPTDECGRIVFSNSDPEKGEDPVVLHAQQLLAVSSWMGFGSPME